MPTLPQTISTMTSVEQKIHEAASRNSQLLSTLAETDYAPPALDQQNRYIKDLENELSKLDKEIARLETTRKKELKDHEKYRDSVMKRFAYKMTRKQEKFDAKASKEEQEYFAALQAEHHAKETRTSTQQTLSQAQSAKTDLENVSSRHRDAQKQLDDLYDSIFEGPTPGFADEDARESAAHSALSTYHTTREQSEAETQVLSILKTAKAKMSQATQHMNDARSASRMDMFGGGSMSDMMERSALHKADQTSLEAQMLVMQAQRLSPHVKEIPRPNIAQGNLMSDVFFDNIFTDMAFHDKIKASQVEAEHSFKAVDAEYQGAQQRLDSLKQKLSTEGRALEDARVALQKAREEAFERVVGHAQNQGQSQGLPPAPAYTA